MELFLVVGAQIRPRDVIYRLLKRNLLPRNLPDPIGPFIELERIRLGQGSVGGDHHLALQEPQIREGAFPGVVCPLFEGDCPSRHAVLDAQRYLGIGHRAGSVVDDDDGQDIGLRSGFRAGLLAGRKNGGPQGEAGNKGYRAQ